MKYTIINIYWETSEVIIYGYENAHIYWQV